MAQAVLDPQDRKCTRELPIAITDILALFKSNEVVTNVRGPKVGIALRSPVFFWPRSLQSTSSKLLRGDII